MVTYDVRKGIKRIKTKTALAISGAGMATTGLVVALAMPLAAKAAAPGYTTFGDATIVSGGNPGNALQLRSDIAVAPGYGGADYNVPSGTTWSNLTTLGTDYNVTNDDCFGGSPRFSIAVDATGDGVADGNVVVAIGPSPSFSGCTTGWQSTGNLIGNNDAGRYDFSHLGGSQFTTYSGAPASVQSGTVTGISLIVDSSWGFTDGEQTILIDNTNINGSVYDYEPVPSLDTCKNNGWMQFTNPSFKNQGQCVSYAQHTNGIGQDDAHAKAVR